MPRTKAISWLYTSQSLSLRPSPRFSTFFSRGPLSTTTLTKNFTTSCSITTGFSGQIKGNDAKIWRNEVLSASEDSASQKAITASFQTGDLEHPVFNHSNYLGLVEHLHISNSISLEERLTLLMLYCAKSQVHWFSTDSKPKCHQTEESTFISVNDFFTDERTLSKLSEKYLDNIERRANALKLPFSIDQFLKDVSQLPTHEQRLYNFTLPEDYSLNESLYIAANVMPCISIKDDYFQENLSFPSGYILHLLFKQMVPHHFKMKPVIGLTDDALYFKLHCNNTHPLAVFHKGLEERLEHFHGYISTPFAILFHDIFHVFMSGVLSLEQREYLFRRLIPYLQQQLQSNHIERSHKMSLAHAIFELSDLNLTTDGGLIYDLNTYISEVIKHLNVNNQHKNWIQNEIDMFIQKNDIDNSFSNSEILTKRKF